MKNSKHMHEAIYPKEIELFFTKIINQIKEVLDPDFVLIAGSFGKESWLFNENELISDFEFVFVCSKKWSLKSKKSLLKDLNKEYPYDISLKGYLKKNVESKVISNYSLKNPGYISLDFFDTFKNPVILYSKNKESIKIDIKIEEIPIWEAWRLYINRIGDLFSLLTKNNIPNHLEKYYWLKTFESIGDAYLIVRKIYESNILKRSKLLKSEFIKNDDDLNNKCKESFDIINQAIAARQNHDLLLFESNLNMEKCKDYIISWLDYFENKLRKEESLFPNDVHNFYHNYLNSKSLQNKYLGFNYRFNIYISNTLLLIFHSRLLNSSYKFYNHNVSWKHTILLSISSLVREYNLELKDYKISKSILSSLLKKKYVKNLSQDDFIKTTIKYWKIIC